jgi:uncharacterized protein YqhQ
MKPQPDTPANPLLGPDGELRVGGMALENGLLLHSPRYWAAAIRDDDGAVTVASGEKSALGAVGRSRVPLVRGVARLVDALALLPAVKAKLGRAVLPVEAPRMLAAVGVAAALTLGVRRERGSVVRQELGAAALALVPAMIALKNSRLAGYHGAEHKSIGEYERVLRGEDPEGATKEHERCGSNLMGPLLAANLIGNVLVRKVSRRPTPGATLAAGLLSVGSAMELFRWMSRHPESKVAHALGLPGDIMQRFVTTDEPDSGQMEVAHAALAELLRLEGVPLPA